MNRIPRELVDSIIQYLHLILQNQSTDGVGKRKLSSFSSVSRTFQASIEGITFHHLSAEAKDLEFLDKILNTRRRALVHSFSFKIKLYESDIRHNKRKLSGLLDLIHSLGHPLKLELGISMRSPASMAMPSSRPQWPSVTRPPSTYYLPTAQNVTSFRIWGSLKGAPDIFSLLLSKLPNVEHITVGTKRGRNSGPWAWENTITTDDIAIYLLTVAQVQNLKRFSLELKNLSSGSTFPSMPHQRKFASHHLLHQISLPLTELTIQFGRHEPLLTADLFCMDEENPDYSGSWPNLKKLDIEFSMASQLFSLSDFLSGTKTPPVPAKEERYFSRLILGILEAIPRMPKIEEIRIVICGYRRDGAWGDVHSPLCFAFSPSKWRRLKEGAADCTLGGTSLGEKIESGGFLTQTEICPLPWDIPNDGPVPPMPLFLLDEDGSVDRYATPKPWCPSRIAVQRWEEIWDAL